MKKIVLGILLISMLSMATLFTSCKNDSSSEESNDGTETLRLVWWGSQTRADATTEVTKMFQKDNAKVKFETEFYEFPAYWDKMATLAASNSLPDIMQHDYAFIGQYVEKGQLENLQPYVDSGVFDKTDIKDEILNTGKLKDGLYGISLGVNSMNLMYNPKVYQDAGVAEPTNDMTWEDYINGCKAVYDKTGVKTGMPFLVDPKLLFEYWVRSAGKSLYSPDGKSLGFDDPKLLQSLFEEEVKMIKYGMIHSIEEALVPVAIEESEFVKGNDTSGFSWSNFMVPYSLAMKSEIATVVLPKAPSGDKPGMYIKPSMFFSVPKSSKHKDTAVKFINYFTNSIDANKVLKADRGVPISSKVRDALKQEVEVSTKQTFDYIDIAADVAGPIDPPEPVGAAEVQQLAKDLNAEVCLLKTTPEEAAKKFIEKANELLSSN